MAAPITSNINNWKVSEHNVERLTDNIPFTSAHPDDTLVLVGPPRYSQLNGSQDGLYAIGMLQQFNYSQSRGLQPMQAIGSGRAFFVTGKSTIQFQIGRLFVKGKNLMRALYENAKSQGGLPIDTNGAFGERPIAENVPNFATNLDSPLFLVPFGLCVIYRDRSNAPLGGVYLENCMLSSFQSSIMAGQTNIMESVNGMGDRLFAIDLGSNSSSIQDGWPVGGPDAASNGVPDAIETYMFGAPQNIGNGEGSN